LPSCQCVHSSGLCAYGCAGSIDRSRRCLPMLLIVGCQTVHITSCRCVHASGLHPHCFFNILPLTPRSVSTTNHIRPWASTPAIATSQVPAAVHLHPHQAPSNTFGCCSRSNSACEAGREHHGIQHWGTSNNKEHTFLLPNHEWIRCNGYSGTSHPTIGPLLYYHHRSTRSFSHSTQAIECNEAGA